ncbi:MFS transporter [Wolbachia endosymbiont of Pentidionis agamae]|uniref:MFS transporter n=1 Tax=Wolbachia endosymbiont of Pentidionis agamae TaxID=3110435 RepID=UPI002FD7648C
MKSLQIKKVLLATIVCNTLLWYDHMIFGHLIDIIGNVFFPSNNSLVSTIKALGVFAVGFLLRPVGAAIFGHIGDKYGRRIALFISIIIMSLSTISIALIPGYQNIGIIAPILVIFMRILQGIALGGEAGNAPFLIEHASRNNKGFLGSIEVLSAILGSILSLIVIFLCKQISHIYFESWGWRLPFILSLVIGLLSIYMRYILDESPAYEKDKKQNKISKSPLKELLKNYKRPFFISICVDIAENASLYIYLVLFGLLTQKAFKISTSFIEIVNQVILGILVLLFAVLSDKIGRRKVLGFAFVNFIVMSYPIFVMLCSNSYKMIMLAHLLFIVPISASLGPVSAMMCELFPIKVRYSGFALSRNIAAGFGGFAPFLCTLIIKITGREIAASYYMIFCALIGLIAILHIKDRDIITN